MRADMTCYASRLGRHLSLQPTAYIIIQDAVAGFFSRATDASRKQRVLNINRHCERPVPVYLYC